MNRNNRVLIVDDNRAIHEDFAKVLAPPPAAAGLATFEAELFGQVAAATDGFVLTSALQGSDAIEYVRAARSAGAPFAVAFVDIRMPPGIDGVETAARLWEIDPDLQIVICSAHSDHSWTDMAGLLRKPERWVVLKKPFDNIEVLQLAHSLSEKWRLQHEANQRRAELEGHVQERTAELQAALAQLERESAERLRAEAERRSFERRMEETQRLESLGVLAGGIAHDFNNLLTGILASASLARLEDTLLPGTDTHLKRIEQSARRAAGLCEQMLAYAGRSQVTLRQIDLNSLVQDTRELLRVSVPHDVDFDIQLAPALPLVRGDSTRIGQVLMNLVINGAEALTREPRRLRLATRCAHLDAAELARQTHPGDARPGDYVCVEVSDTGMGMTPDVQRRIFEPFFTTKFDGRGLGLCAALGIIRSHGGVLSVESQPGVGSTFRVLLPALAQVGVAPAERATAPAHPVSTAIRCATLLVVDDEATVRYVTAMALRARGFEVEDAGGGEEALRLFRRQPERFAGAVLDITMPGMSGAQLLGALREAKPQLPALLMSGFSAEQMAGAIAAQHGVHVLQKPFDLERLYDAVDLMLAAQTSAAAVPGASAAFTSRN